MSAVDATIRITDNRTVVVRATSTEVGVVAELAVAIANCLAGTAPAATTPNTTLRLQPDPEPVAAEPPPIRKDPRRKPNPTPTKTKSSDAKEEPYMCDIAGCDRTFSRPNGLARHMNESHGQAAAPPPAPRPTNGNGTHAPDDTDAVLRCNDCDFTTDVHSFAKLRTHTSIAHGRMPYPGVESRARTANALDLVDTTV